jgi:Xaa-Pro aminopeptidase
MVLALEPKIGIPGLGMVGVENTFLVTPGGGVSLTGDRFGPTFTD